MPSSPNAHKYPQIIYNKIIHSSQAHPQNHPQILKKIYKSFKKNTQSHSRGRPPGRALPPIPPPLPLPLGRCPASPPAWRLSLPMPRAPAVASCTAVAASAMPPAGIPYRQILRRGGRRPLLPAEERGGEGRGGGEE